MLAVLITAVQVNSTVLAQRLDADDRGGELTGSVINDPQLASGFRLLYELKLEQARQYFKDLEQAQPAQPIGPALEAASDLFEDFYRKGVLTSECFLDDKRTPEGIKDQPDSDLYRQFSAHAQRAEELARARLENQPKDPDALFALTLVAGMQADDLFLKKRELESLRHLREADRNARILLEVAPDADDAYVAMGAANYIIGCLPSYKRAMLRVGGANGNKTLGMQQLSRAASSEHAHYLRPFARLMLALAALRERNAKLAKQQLQELVTEFPENPLFAAELVKIAV